MAIVINGSGTVTGLSAGGLPDNTVDNGTMADDAIGVAELSATGTASNSTYLRGDNTWAAAGGASVLGDLTDVSMDITNLTNGLIIQTNRDGSAPTTGTLSNATGILGIGEAVFAALTSGDDSIGLGNRTLTAMTSGSANIAIGSNALDALTTENYNIAIGYNSMSSAVNGAEYNVCVGHNSGNALTTGDYNTAIGSDALYANTTGASNTAVGHACLDSNTTGTRNVAMGREALQSNTTGNYNTAIGFECLAANTTANGNTALGYEALKVNTTGANNVGVGETAADATTTASNLTALGKAALTAVTTGSDNIGIGYTAGQVLTTGTYNILIGRDAGQNLTTGGNNHLIGAYTETSAADSTQQLVLGYNVTGTGNNAFTFGNAGLDSNIDFGATSITAPSDERMKEDVSDDTAGLGFINDLRPVTFKWKQKKDIPVELKSHEAGSIERFKNEYTNHGFIAQEVKEVIDNHPELKDGFDMWKEDEVDGRQRIGDGALIPMLVKAIQELSAKVEALENP